MPMFQVLLLLLVGSLCSAWFAASYTKRRLLKELANQPKPPPSLPTADLEKYLAGIDKFADEVAPVWSNHIESSRRQMDQAVAELTGRFAAITDGLDTLLGVSSKPALGGHDDVFRPVTPICKSRRIAGCLFTGKLAGTEQNPLLGRVYR